MTVMPSDPAYWTPARRAEARAIALAHLTDKKHHRNRRVTKTSCLADGCVLAYPCSLHPLANAVRDRAKDSLSSPKVPRWVKAKQRGEVVPLVIKDGEHMPITKKHARALAMGKRKP